MTKDEFLNAIYELSVTASMNARIYLALQESWL